MKKIYLTITILAFSIMGCIKKSPDLPINPTVKLTPHVPPITIFIHGTRPRFIPKKVVRTAFHCDDGFHHAQEIKSSKITWSLIKTLTETDPKQFPLETFYTHCWSGRLDFKAREIASEKLYINIEKLIENYEKKYDSHPPRIQLICHSHGCNVALNLARVKNRTPLMIDKLILLAGPVQEATANLARHSMFKCVYSLYSAGDSIQILDPQGTYDIAKKIRRETTNHVPLFSGRRLPPSRNVRQVKVKLFGRAPLHIEFIRPHLIKHLPQILNEMDNWKELGMGKDQEYILKIER